MPGNPHATPSEGIIIPGPGGPPPPPGAAAPFGPPAPAAPFGPPAPAAPPKNNKPLIIGLIAGALALCLLGACGAVVGGFYLLGNKHAPGASAASPAEATPAAEDTYSPPPALPTTQAPPPAPVSVGQCIAVDEQGEYLGIGNCNGSSGTYRVVSVDASQGACADPESAYITVDSYRLCLDLYLVRFYCYKFPQGDGWVVAASACKAKGTVTIIDIVPNGSNGNHCTRDYQWNHWYRFEHPTVVYCVMQY